MRQMKVTVGRVVIVADVLTTPTAEALWAALPIEARVAVWGQEIYFPVSVRAEREESAREVIEPGELAYRAEGEAVVIAWGPTPVSEGAEIRLAAPGNVFARTSDDVKRLAEIEPGALVRVEALS